MKKKAAPPKRARSAHERPKRSPEEKAWNAAEWQYAQIAGAATMPLLGRSFSREEQVGELEALIRGCPAYYPAILHLGLLQGVAGLTETAGRLLRQGVDRMAARGPLREEDRDAIGRLIDHLEGSLCHDLASDLLQRLTAHYPSEPYLHDLLGGVRVVLGQCDEAIRSFEKAVELDPQGSRYHCNLAWGCLEGGRLDRARAHLERSLEIDSGDDVAHGNHQVLRFLERHGGRFADYLVRPLDHKKLARLEKRAEGDGDYEELDQAAGEWNHARLEAWKWELCRRREPDCYAELYKSVRAFLRFVEELSQESYILYEDLGSLSRRFVPVMHKFIFKMSDADAAIVEEICAGLLSFYGFLAARGVLDESAFAAFRSEVLGLKQGLIEKAERYAEIRHDHSIPEREKERIREALFDGDHRWPWT